MTRTSGLTFAAAALFGAVLLATTDETGEAVPTTPFWQLQGAAPAAGETADVQQLRMAQRNAETRPFVVAGR